METVRLETLLTEAAAGVVTVSALWMVLVTAATVLELLTGLSSAAVRAVTPSAVRRVVVLCCGAAVGGAGVLAPANADRIAPGDAVVGLPLPDRTTGVLLDPPAVAGPVDRTTVGDTSHTLHIHVVRAGESLWSIASTAWPALYRANRALVGPDPDHIVPGTALRLPPRLWHDPRSPRSQNPPHHRKDAS